MFRPASPAALRQLRLSSKHSQETVLVLYLAKQLCAPNNPGTGAASRCVPCGHHERMRAADLCSLPKNGGLALQLCCSVTPLTQTAEH